MRNDDLTRILASKIYLMLTMIKLMIRPGRRPSIELSRREILARDPQTDTLTGVEIGSDRPDSNIQLHDLSGRDFLLLLVRVEGKIRVDAARGIDGSA